MPKPTVTLKDRRGFVADLGKLGIASFLASRITFEARAATTQIPQDILYTSARSLAERIRSKQLSSLEVTKAYIERIEAVNPTINAVVTPCYERALAEAKKADAAIARGITGPLLGVPFTVKDSHDTAGVLSTGGTLGRKDFIPAEDATYVKRIRDAGAIMLGKTNTPELTLSYQTTNLIFGRTENPYKVGYQPGGSTGGGAAIIAAGGSPFDLGTDFGGSIRVPAHSCGIAGHKPTAGLVPRTGHIVGYGGTFDAFQVVGPLARWVEDLEPITKLIKGPDFIDAAIVPAVWEDVSTINLKNLRVAWYYDNGSYESATPETIECIKKCARILESAGLTVQEDCPKDLIKESQELRNAMSGADGREWVRRMLKGYGTKQVSPNINTGAGSHPVDTERFTEIVELMDLNRSKLLQWFQNYDLILAPIDLEPAQPWPIEKSGGPPAQPNYGHTPIYNNTGWPGTAVRAGTSPNGLPIGVQVIARPFYDSVGIAAAKLIESSTGGYVQPKI